MDVSIRAATARDLVAVSAIYAHEVRDGIATFDLEPPPLDYWRARLESREHGDHLLVLDDGVAVLGYAYSSSYRPRPAYALTRETSIYLAGDARGRGLGRRLYDDLLGRLRADGVHTVVALVALSPDPWVCVVVGRVPPAWTVMPTSGGPHAWQRTGRCDPRDLAGHRRRRRGPAGLLRLRP